MLNINDINRYFLRLTALPEVPELAGQVVYLRRVSQEGMFISTTDDCRPVPELLKLSAKSNDDGWYDVTELMLAANCAITPRYDLCVFDNDTAKQYRNHVDAEDTIKVYDSRQAVGKLCFLGRKTAQGVELSTTAHFIVATDDRGFSVTYSGFCNPKPKKRGTKHRLTQRVLRLEGTGQFFVDATSIVRFCNSSYNTDLERKEQFLCAIEDKVATSSLGTTQAEQQRKKADGLAGLNLT